uniref:AAA+ ATPase domain-containing protein n=1 Tax=Oryza nivara TaxID=4536 RepID=A0A0E0JCV0_ORYNI
MAMGMMENLGSVSTLWSALVSVLLFWPVVNNHVPAGLRQWLSTMVDKLTSYLSPYLHVTISEYGHQRFRRSDFFLAVEAYLSHACARRARKLRADLGKDARTVQITVDDHQEVTDSFRGATIWWYPSKKPPRTNVISFYPRDDDARFYRLVFHRRHRDLVLDAYLPHVLAEGRAVTIRNRQRRLFTNNAPGASTSYYSRKSVWSHVPFEHPATFDTLAMEPADKDAILDDLTAFRDSKDYYAKVGKAWKRGYLLHGPPGTGKSTMIAAMANFLDYDVYDLELTAVKTNTDLRKLYIETTGKSIIVIEDIDCSVDLTAKRSNDKKKKKSSDEDDDDKPKLPTEQEKDEASKVTLSGLLNFIDGLWSACGGERIIIFTTNHKEKLDPALIRRGRMDVHIEMSYCRFEAFKVLAKNYLGVEQHEMFVEIRRLLEEIDMSPADVAENLMPKASKGKKRDPDACLAGLIEALNKAKVEAAEAAKAKEEEEAAAAKAKEEEEAAKAKAAKEKEKDDEAAGTKHEELFVLDDRRDHICQDRARSGSPSL